MQKIEFEPIPVKESEYTSKFNSSTTQAIAFENLNDRVRCKQNTVIRRKEIN